MTGGTSPTVFLVAFVVYIAVMIFIGWYSSRGKSEGTDYLTGGRGLNLLMIFGTIGATMIGTGSSMGAHFQWFPQRLGRLDLWSWLLPGAGAHRPAVLRPA